MKSSAISLVVVGQRFCVVVYNNVVARLCRLPPSMLEAGRWIWRERLFCLGAFLPVVLPQLAITALAGGLLAFGLSFDELIVITFTAGSGQICRSCSSINSAASRHLVTNVVAMVVIVIDMQIHHAGSRLPATR